jgi:hypothetical protein
VNGLALQTYVLRRLAEEGLALEANRTNELYDYITEGRDELLASFALAAPIVVQSAPIALVQVDAINDPRLWKIPDLTKDLLRVITVRETESKERFSPSGGIEQDAGDYEWVTTRQLRFSESADPGSGIEIIVVPHQADITAATTEALIGLPTPCHRAIGKYAAVLALTADEESDATNALGLFSRELDRLERIYGDFDAMGGAALRSIFMESIGQLSGDTIY